MTRELFREPWLWWAGFFTLLQERVEAHLRAKDLPRSKWAACSFITTLNRVAGRWSGAADLTDSNQSDAVADLRVPLRGGG